MNINMKTTRNSAQPKNQGFSLVEIMVVVIILGVLAATIVPQFAGTTHDAKVSMAKSHIAEMKTALTRFYVSMDRYPTEEEGLQVLVDPPADDDGAWRGPYLERVLKDPWNSPYQYRFPGQRAPNYDLWSRGADKADGGTDKGADIGNWAEDEE